MKVQALERTIMKITVQLAKKNAKPLAGHKEVVASFTSQSPSKNKKGKAKAHLLSSDKLLKSIFSDLEAGEALTGKAYEISSERNVGEHKSGALFVGIGVSTSFDAEVLRRAAAHFVKALKSLKAERAQLHLGTFPKGVDSSKAVQAITEGILLGNYDFTELKSENKEKKALNIELLVEGRSNPKTLSQALETGVILGECVNFSRRLGDLPGNHMTPEILAEETQKAARGTGLKVTVWDKTRIKKEKMGCLLGVSLGSSAEPRFIIMEYKGAPASKKPICFVGKGLTFDSGGISIKPSANMEEMKYDMCGGANTIGTLLAIARLKLKVNVIGLVPSSENMPGPLANKPGDVLTARNGKTVEVNNTDAEGRLILADALSYASELKPAFIVDSATLTGAMVVALGDLHTGYFSRNAKLTKAIHSAAAISGEQVWHMPLVDEHVEDMKGVYADLNNISLNKGAGSAHGAAFLECFVDKDIPWAHSDIAGTAWHVGHRLPYSPRRGASGCMVRTYVELAKKWT